MDKRGRSVEVRGTGPQHILEGEEMVLAPEVVKFIENLKRLGICP